MTTSVQLASNFCSGEVLLLDGPTGTELERRGMKTSMPLWSAMAPVVAPNILREIYDEYVDAGADILTANTFRTSHYCLAKVGLERDCASLTRKAVQISRSAAERVRRPVMVAGSIAPLEDCYAPELTPDATTLTREHRRQAETLLNAPVDLLVVESMPTKKEALIATGAAVATGLPVITSLLAREGATLFDGTPLMNLLNELLVLPIELVAVNCCSVRACSEAIWALAQTHHPFGAYANAGQPDGSFGKQVEPMDVDEYARAARGWIEAGASLVGGCCGTQPKHIARLRQLIDHRRV